MERNAQQKEGLMECTASQARAHRLRAHHLDRKLPPATVEQAAGACGLQNSPPGAWGTALHNRCLLYTSRCV